MHGGEDGVGQSGGCEELADHALDREVDVGGHVAVALGPDVLRLVRTCAAARSIVAEVPGGGAEHGEHAEVVLLTDVEGVLGTEQRVPDTISQNPQSSRETRHPWTTVSMIGPDAHEVTVGNAVAEAEAAWVHALLAINRVATVLEGRE